MKNKLPDYVNCQNKNIEICEYYMTKSCPETCAYALNIRGIGIGAMSEGDLERISKDGKTIQNSRDMV